MATYLTPSRVPADGGVASAGRAPVNFDPTQVAGLAGWWSADDGLYSDAGITPVVNGGTIQQWNDRSGNGRHLIQLTSGLRPTWTALSVLINRQPFVQMSGGKSMQAIFSMPEPCTIYMANRVAVPVAGNYVIDGGVGNNSQAVLIGSPTNNRQMRKNLVDPGLLIDFGPRFALWSVSAYCFNGAASVASVTAVNTSPAGDPGSTPLSSGGLTIGARADFLLPTNGSFAEIIMYAGTHDINTMNRIGTYLRLRYAF